MISTNPIPQRFATETYEQVVAAAMPESHADINGVLAFDGHLDDERLTQAVLTAISSEPMWDVRFVEHWMTPYWEANRRDERPRLITRVLTEDVPTAVRDWLEHPVTTGISVRLLRTAAGDTLCFRADHRLVDGTSLRLFVAEVARNYRLGTVSPTVDAPMVRRTLRMVPCAVSLSECIKGLRELTQRLRSPRLGFEMPRPTQDAHCSLPRQLHYPAGAVTQLSARALRDRATLMMAIQAATTLALRDIAGLCPGVELLQLHLVDLRRYLPEDEQSASACLLVGSVATWVEARHAESMAALLTHTREQFQRLRGPKFGQILSPLAWQRRGLRRLLSWIPYRTLRRSTRTAQLRDDRTPAVGFTQMGDYGKPGESWGAATLRDAYATGGIRRLSEITVAVSTCDTQLTISVNAGLESFVCGLCQRIDAHLAEYTGWPFRGTAPEPMGSTAAARAKSTGNEPPPASC